MDNFYFSNNFLRLRSNKYEAPEHLHRTPTATPSLTLYVFQILTVIFHLDQDISFVSVPTPRSHNMHWPSEHYGLERFLIHRSHDLAFVGQHDLQIKTLRKKTISFFYQWDPSVYLRCCQTYAYIQGIARVNFVISITLEGSSFPVRIHICE